MRKHQAGFTILELLIVIAILLVGASITLPSIIDIGRRDRVKAEARDIKNIFFRARMEAIRRNQSITVVFNQNGYACMAFIDTNDSCEYDTGDSAIISSTNLSYAKFDDNKGGGDGLTFVANDNNKPALRWDTRGLPHRNGTGFGSGTVYLCGANAHYRIIVSRTGNTRITRY